MTDQVDGSERFTLRTETGLRLQGFLRNDGLPQRVDICNNAGIVIGSLEIRERKPILHISTTRGSYRLSNGQLREENHDQVLFTLGRTFAAFRNNKITGSDADSFRVRCSGRLVGKIVMELFDDRNAIVLTVRRTTEPRSHPLDQAEAILAPGQNVGRDAILLVAMGYVLYEIQRRPLSDGGVSG